MTTLIVPMAGRGQRFEEKGYIFPKPLIEINGKLMVEYVMENFESMENLNYVFVVLKEHDDKFHISSVMKRLVPDAKIKMIDSITDGAARTVLLVDDLIDDDDDVIVCNCDQWLEWDAKAFFEIVKNSSYHWITTFNSIHPKFSYVKYDGEKVTEVQEKNPISDIATTGIYYWKSWKDFKWAANSMITKNRRINNEFYVCPVYQELVERGDIIKIYPVTMHSLGTPEDLAAFNLYLKRKELSE